MCSPCRPLLGVLGRYRPEDAAEAADVARVRALAETAADPWLRSIPLHVTASALVVHPDSGRVLLRWHQRQQAWLQVGGHADPGESDPLAVALREAGEETGLADLTPWPDASGCRCRRREQPRPRPTSGTCCRGWSACYRTDAALGWPKPGFEGQVVRRADGSAAAW